MPGGEFNIGGVLNGPYVGALLVDPVRGLTADLGLEATVATPGL